MDSAKTILVTGGAGYIGSHTCVALSAAGCSLVIFDNLSTGKLGVVDRLSRLCNEPPTVIVGDIRDETALARVFAEHPIDAVMHFAGLKAVGESVEQPLRYFDNNVSGTLRLLEAMARADVNTIVFSSSATVYGAQLRVPFTEVMPTAATNPYARTKLMIEEILRDLHRADPGWRIGCLRYFNPVGAHESGMIGEDPQGVPNNLMPYMAQVAIGKREYLTIWGNDYDTPDGTGVRDYIHVMDLAEGHVAALDYLARQGGLLTVNLGSGVGHSVLDMVAAFERACGRPVPYRIGSRRAGDVATMFADPGLAAQTLGWRARRDLAQMCADAWRWQEFAVALD